MSIKAGLTRLAAATAVAKPAAAVTVAVAVAPTLGGSTPLGLAHFVSITKYINPMRMIETFDVIDDDGHLEGGEGGVHEMSKRQARKLIEELSHPEAHLERTGVHQYKYVG